jgi:hypothetical protein
MHCAGVHGGVARFPNLFERHFANRTLARPLGSDLRMHRARVALGLRGPLVASQCHLKPHRGKADGDDEQ